MENQGKNKEQKSLTHSSFQKFYSALISINHFRLENNSFENTSYLDNFFSEFRSITLVLQNNLPEGKNNPIYHEMNVKYFSTPEMKWFVNKRNQVIHKNPVSLMRLFRLEIYGISSIITKRTYFYDDEDHPQEDIQKAIRIILDSLNAEVEVNFSVRHLIIDKNSLEDMDMIDLIRKGIRTMWEFLNSVRNMLSDDSPPLQRLDKEINKLLPEILNNEILFIIDYVYHVKENKIIAATVGMVKFGLNIDRQKLENITKTFRYMSINLDSNIDLYKWFIYYNIPLYGMGMKNLMSTFFIIYNDNSYSIQPFFSNLRSTAYRMINEVATMVEEGKVRAVVFMWEGIGYDITQAEELSKMTYEDRKKLATSETVNIDLISKRTTRSIVFDPNRVNEKGYISNVMDLMQNKSIGLFLTPITKAFEELE